MRFRAIAVAFLSGFWAMTVAADQAAMPPPDSEISHKVPRGPDGKPDLNGFWQVMNRANINVEPQSARAAHAMVAGDLGPIPAPEVVKLGAVGSVPATLGVVEGGEIPYKPEARQVQQENQADWLNRDPEIKCYLPGIPRATLRSASVT